MSQQSGKIQGTDQEHPASGTAVLTDTQLRLEDTNITQAPDAQAYLATDFNKDQGIKLGELKSFKGTMEYDLPTGVDPKTYNTVVIWCAEFGVPIAQARLEG